MSLSLGRNFKIELAGASHSKEIKASIFGVNKGIYIDKSIITFFIDNRRPKDGLSTTRKEIDIPIFTSGIDENNITTGEPISFYFENKDVDDSNYVKGICRPGHGDLTGYLKYKDEYDYKGGGIFSGRMMLPIVVIGAILKQIINSKYNIEIYSHIYELYNLKDVRINRNNKDGLYNKNLPIIDNDILISAIELIKKIKAENDSIGGSIETMITNVPVGLGDAIFDSFESILSYNLFSIPGVKGVNFGDGSDFITLKGSEVVDEMEIKDNKIYFKANHNGGINGGISNGNDIIFKTIFKPISSIGKVVDSINIISKENIKLEVKGRHDPTILTRASIIVDSMSYITLFDLLLENHAI